jgi:uncharacterized YigZ family protein
MYLVIKKYCENETVINKSRFICTIGRATSKEKAEEFIKTVTKNYYNATHNCFAYIIGEDHLIQKASDDGEPSGTAGIPMLEVLKKHNLTDTVCVVTRYFGGIKLGTGGLIRAYGNAVSEAIKKSGINQIKPVQIIEIEFDYAQTGLIDNKLSNYNVINKLYLEKVFYTYQIEVDKVQSFIDYLINITNNNISYSLKDMDTCEINYA